MKKFNTLIESILEDLNSLEEFETEIEPTIVSYNEFKHFCKELDLIAELDKDMDMDSNNAIECSLYFMKQFDNDNKPVKFDFFNQYSRKYYNEHLELFNILKDYKKRHIVTLEGDTKSPEIIWG